VLVVLLKSKLRCCPPFLVLISLLPQNVGGATVKCIRRVLIVARHFPDRSGIYREPSSSDSEDFIFADTRIIGRA
jgi:hypothetical protein